jgi:hypothetical protein
VARDFLQNRKGAAERLDADPLPLVGFVVDVCLPRRHQFGDRRLARGLLLTGRLLGTRSHRMNLHATKPNFADGLIIVRCRAFTQVPVRVLFQIMP